MGTRSIVLALWIILVTAVTLCVVGCGDNLKQYTWGDATAEVTEGFCNRLAVCGAFGNTPDSPRQRDQCIAHAEFHFCLEGTCAAPLPEGSEEIVSECVASVASADCYWLYFSGILPPACNPFWELEPAR